MRIAARRRGACLSESHKNSLTALEWQCANGHRWRAIPNSIRQGHWCKQCADAKRRKTLEEIQELAAKREGKLLSATYVNSQSSVLWQCAIGHRWKAIPNSVSQGSWCPQCA